MKSDSSLLNSYDFLRRCCKDSYAKAGDHSGSPCKGKKFISS